MDDLQIRNLPKSHSIVPNTTVRNTNDGAGTMELLNVLKEAQSYTNLDDANNTSVAYEEDMDYELFHLLSNWGFVDFYDYFKSCKLSVDVLKVIDNEDLKEIFANKDIGVRFEFKHKLLQWRRENGFGVPCDLPEDIAKSIKILVEDHLKDITSSSTISISRTPSPSPSNYSTCSNPASPSIGSYNFDIDTILNEHPSGTFVLTDYKKNNRIGDSSRQILIDCISSWLIKNYKSVSRKEFSNIAEKIQERFGEDKNIYYSAPPKGKKENPSGRLYSRFYNTKRRFKQIGVDFLPPFAEEPSSETSSIIEVEETEVALAEAKWLQMNKEPWDEVKVKWRRTHALRLKDVRMLKFAEFLNNWPLLRHSAGITLIDVDFAVLYPGKENSLIEKWDCFKSLIIPVFNEKVKDKYCQDLLLDLNKKDFKKGPEDVLILELLHAILPPSARQTKQQATECKRRKYYKHTIKDSQELFIQRVKEANNFNPAVDKLAEKVRELRQSLQPFVIYCMFNNTFITYYNDLKYKFSSILPALDLCLKIFFVFNLEYPTACRTVWIFLQKYFYDIETKERVPADILVLIELLKQRQNA